MAPGAEPSKWPLEQYREYLLLMARLHMERRLQSKVDASDIVQETLLRAHEKRDQFRGQSEDELAAWLRQILANNLKQVCRKYGRQRRDVEFERSLEPSMESSSAKLEAWLAADLSGPPKKAERNEQVIRLAKALAQLPEDQRIVLETRHLRGESVAAISKSMCRSEQAVAGLLRRGLQGLRQLMVESG